MGCPFEACGIGLLLCKAKHCLAWVKLMKKLLLHFDTDPIASSFDAVVAYDSDIDHLIQYAGVNIDNCASLVEGAIYTRAPKDKKNTAIFISGSDMEAGEKLYDAVTKQFFQGFSVSLMLDSNGCNTTAAAAIALLQSHLPIKGKTAMVLAGTGPVGQRAAAMLLMCGAQQVRVGSRTEDKAAQACEAISQKFGVQAHPVGCADSAQMTQALEGVNIVCATGKAGIQLLSESQWSQMPELEALVDVNTCPPSGIEGLKVNDRGESRGNVLCFGGLGVGALKLKLQRHCISKLFESNDLVWHTRNILDLAQQLLDNKPKT